MNRFTTAIIFAVMATPAFASPFTLTDGTAGLTTGDLVGTITYTGTPSLNESVFIGPLNMTVTNNANNFSFQQSVYCTDIFNDYVAGGVYNLSASSLSTNIGSTKYEQIDALLSNANVSDNAQGAAVQAVIWEIINEPGITNYSLTTGQFTVSGVNSSEFSISAAEYLTNITNGTWKPNNKEVVMEYTLIDGQNPNQTFSYLALGPNVIDAPEPMSIGIFGMGLAGLIAARRKKVV